MTNSNKPICPECDGSGRTRTLGEKDICSVCGGGK